MTKPNLTKELQKQICDCLQRAGDEIKKAHRLAIIANDMQIKKFMGSEVLRIEEQRVRISQKTSRKPTAQQFGVAGGYLAGDEI